MITLRVIFWLISGRGVGAGDLSRRTGLGEFCSINSAELCGELRWVQINLLIKKAN